MACHNTSLSYPFLVLDAARLLKFTFICSRSGGIPKKELIRSGIDCERSYASRVQHCGVDDGAMLSLSPENQDQRRQSVIVKASESGQSVDHQELVKLYDDEDPDAM
jgi:hypothetical protein